MHLILFKCHCFHQIELSSAKTLTLLQCHKQLHYVFLTSYIFILCIIFEASKIDTDPFQDNMFNTVGQTLFFLVVWSGRVPSDRVLIQTLSPLITQKHVEYLDSCASLLDFSVKLLYYISMNAFMFGKYILLFIIQGFKYFIPTSSLLKKSLLILYMYMYIPVHIQVIIILGRAVFYGDYCFLCFVFNYLLHSSYLD